MRTVETTARGSLVELEPTTSLVAPAGRNPFAAHLKAERPPTSLRTESFNLFQHDSQGEFVWKKDGPPSSGHIHTHPIGVHVHSETGERILVKGGPSHTLRADFATSRFMEIADLEAPRSSLIKDEKGLLLGIEFLEGYEGGMELPERFHDDERIQKGLLVQTMVFNYDCVPWNFMWEKEGGQGVSFIDFGASCGSRAQGGFNGFPDKVDAEQLRHVLTNPQFGGPANPAFDNLVPLAQVEKGQIVVKKPELMREMVTTLSRITDESIDTVVREAWEDIPREESLADLQGRLAKLDSKSEYKSSLARQTIQVILDDFEGDQAAYFAHALKGRRDSLLEMFKPHTRSDS